MKEMIVVVSELYAEARRIEHEAQRAYDNAPHLSGYWANLDLRASAAFRLSAGEMAGYVRAVAFSNTVRAIIGETSEVEVFKELGDGVLLYGNDWRPFYELASLLDSLTRHWRVDQSGRPSLEMRMSLTFGSATRLGDDYLGSPIDLCARINGLDLGTDSIATLESSVAENSRQDSSREYPYLSISDSQLIAESQLKAGEPARRVASLKVDRTAFNKETRRFTSARKYLSALQR